MCKCIYCKKDINDDDYITELRHYIHKNCYNDYIKTDSYCREKFLDIIWQSYTDKPNFHQLSHQYDTLIGLYGFTPQGLLYALQYYIKRKEWNTDYLLYQAFPSLYYEARDYYKQEFKIKNKLSKTKKHNVVDIKGKLKSYVPPLELK